MFGFLKKRDRRPTPYYTGPYCTNCRKLFGYNNIYQDLWYNELCIDCVVEKGLAN